MAEAWQTLEEAALTLGISSRTLHRRLARGEFQTRMENGRREVLVVIEERDPSLDRLAAAGRKGMSHGVTDAAADTSASAADMATTPDAAEDYGNAIGGAAEAVQQTMLALHEDRIRRTDLAIMAYQQSVMVAGAEARRAVTRSRVAWSVAGVMAVAMFLGVTWATHRVTQATAEVSQLADNVRQLSGAVEVKSREIQELTRDSQAAKVSAARAEGELVAAKRQVDQLIQDREAERARLSGHVIAADVPATAVATRPALSAAAATQPVLADSRAILPTATTRPVGE
jgi:outer membrane murein-binding lipoprotein Lpp